MIPADWEHVEKYPYRALQPAIPQVAERALVLPSWHWTHDQGSEGACEGHGNAMMMSILNKKRYDPFELYYEGRRNDEWPGEDYDGTSGRAVCKVLQQRGPCVGQQFVQTNDGVHPKKTLSPSTTDGIQRYRWATTVDEMRAALNDGNPIAIGINWYRQFDPNGLVKRGTDWWIDETKQLGSSDIRGGHCVCLYRVSDKNQAFRVKNSWGKDYPLVWLPYKTMETLLSQYGEAALITDR